MAKFFGSRYRTVFNVFNPNRFMSRQSHNQLFAEALESRRQLAKLKLHYDLLMFYKRKQMAERKKLDEKILEIRSSIEKLENMIAHS